MRIKKTAKQVVCDVCGKSDMDLSEYHNPGQHDFLIVSEISIGGGRGFFPRTYHDFCSRECIAKWAEGKK